jgi:hypothetical protein
MITTDNPVKDKTIEDFLKKYPILKSVVSNISTVDETMKFIEIIDASPLLGEALKMFQESWLSSITVSDLGYTRMGEYTTVINNISLNRYASDFRDYSLLDFSNAEEIVKTLAHELGHYLDYDGLRGGNLITGYADVSASNSLFEYAFNYITDEAEADAFSKIRGSKEIKLSGLKTKIKEVVRDVWTGTRAS